MKNHYWIHTNLRLCCSWWQLHPIWWRHKWWLAHSFVQKTREADTHAKANGNAMYMEGTLCKGFWMPTLPHRLWKKSVPKIQFRFWKTKDCSKKDQHLTEQQRKECAFAHTYEDSWCLVCKMYSHLTNNCCSLKHLLHQDSTSPHLKCFSCLLHYTFFILLVGSILYCTKFVQAWDLIVTLVLSVPVYTASLYPKYPANFAAVFLHFKFSMMKCFSTFKNKGSLYMLSVY